MKTIYEMEVNKKVKKGNENVYEKIGTVSVPFPTLADIAEAAQIAPTGVDDEGVPTYGNQIADFLQATLLEAAKKTARNRLVNGTINLRAGASIPATLEALATPAVNTGEALKALTELKKLFAAHVEKLEGLSANAKGSLQVLFGSKVALSLQPAEKRARFMTYVTDFVETLSDEQAAQYEGYLTSLADIVAAEDEEDDDF